MAWLGNPIDVSFWNRSGDFGLLEEFGLGMLAMTLMIDGCTLWMNG